MVRTDKSGIRNESLMGKVNHAASSGTSTGDRTVAVLLPVYGKDKTEYMRLAVESMLGQSYKSLYLLIGVDGPVSGDMKTLLEGYGRRENVQVVWLAENRGLACVLNALLDVCVEKGYHYIARMDADDVSVPDRIERQMRYLDEHADVDIVGGAIEEIDEEGKLRNKVIVYPETPRDCYAFFAFRNPHAHSAVLFRSRFFDRTGCFYRPSYRNEDTMLWFDGFKAGTQNANIKDVVLQYRVTDTLFRERRNGLAFARKQLSDRLVINRELHYGLKARLFAYAMFMLLISPSFLKKIAYRIFR